MNAQPTTGHTPGPWAIDAAPAGSRITIQAGTLTVCEVGWPCRESEADARLIAAAPELLAALRQAYTALEKSVHFETSLPFWRKGGDGYAAAMDARAAIAKAEGSAQ